MLRIDGLTKRFGATLAVDRAELEVASGELVCLLGPSGCGKSTLLRMIAGLAEADRGRVEIDGEDLTRVSANRRPTAMVFQSHALWTHMTVAGNIGFGLRVRGLAKPEIEAKVAAALDLVGLDGFARRLPTELSGGQAQRVALARSLVVEPKLLLMDEPFSALDAHLRQHLREELKALQRRLGLTILFVTHDQEEAMEIAERIVVMNAGRIEQIGRPSELYARPRTRFVATFIGLANMAKVEVAGGRLAWSGLDIEAGVSDGAYEAMTRPEDIAIIEHPGGAPGAFAARVERVVDLGPVRRAHLALADGTTLRAETAQGRDLRVGDAVRARPGRVLLYRDGLIAAELEPAGAARASTALPAPELDGILT
jgi:putative spermidine/putrescine transport system ATP-binding protein